MLKALVASPLLEDEASQQSHKTRKHQQTRLLRVKDKKLRQGQVAVSLLRSGDANPNIFEAEGQCCSNNRARREDGKASQCFICTAGAGGNAECPTPTRGTSTLWAEKTFSTQLP